MSQRNTTNAANLEIISLSTTLLKTHTGQGSIATRAFQLVISEGQLRKEAEVTRPANRYIIRLHVALSGHHRSRKSSGHTVLEIPLLQLSSGKKGKGIDQTITTYLSKNEAELPFVFIDLRVQKRTPLAEGTSWPFLEREDIVSVATRLPLYPDDPISKDMELEPEHSSQELVFVKRDIEAEFVPQRPLRRQSTLSQAASKAGNLMGRAFDVFVGKGEYGRRRGHK